MAEEPNKRLPPTPKVSEDGRFYWDGQRWVPMPGPPQKPLSRWSTDMRFQFWTTLAAGVLVLVLVAAFAVYMSLQKSNEVERQICEDGASFGLDDC